VEPYANPPVVYYEGRNLCISELEAVTASLLDAIARQEVRCRWLDAHGVQAASCQEAYRRRAGESAQEAM
jgi:hypothetical protein